MSESLNRYSIPAKVLKRAPTADLLKLAKSNHAFDASVFEDNAPFFWSAEISNGKLDSWGTRMALSSLQNYAEDANNGISFMDSHQSHRLPLGRSLAGRLEGEGESARVIADFYTIRGLKFNEATYQTTDDFINSVRAGIASDVSIGFIPGEFICSICKVDMWDRDQRCPHYPGDEIEIKDENSGEALRKETVFAWVTNARLSEVSAVYDGSTPGAMILKAERAIREGTLTPEKVRLLEHRYRINLPDSRTAVAVGKSQPEVEIMPEKTPQEPTEREGSSLHEAQMRQVTELVSQSAAPKDIAVVEQVRFLIDENKRLIPLAEDGKKYREDLLAETMAEGVRAYGTDFKEETYRAMLASAPIETVKQTRDDWARIANATFKGGRQTTDAIEGEPLPARQAPQVNPAAFRA